jgi:hypothetical protein
MLSCRRSSSCAKRKGTFVIRRARALARCAGALTAGSSLSGRFVPAGTNEPAHRLVQARPWSAQARPRHIKVRHLGASHVRKNVVAEPFDDGRALLLCGCVAGHLRRTSMEQCMCVCVCVCVCVCACVCVCVSACACASVRVGCSCRGCCFAVPEGIGAHSYTAHMSRRPSGCEPSRSEDAGVRAYSCGSGRVGGWADASLRTRACLRV